MSALVLGVPMLTLLVAEGVAQMRLAHTMTDTATRLLADGPKPEWKLGGQPGAPAPRP